VVEERTEIYGELIKIVVKLLVQRTMTYIDLIELLEFLIEKLKLMWLAGDICDLSQDFWMYSVSLPFYLGV